jgi:DHA1 family bicyclomycin/chloramphenicol resistance-like MFS transporter
VNKEPSFSSPSRLGFIVVMSLLSMIGPFAIDTYLPSFPTIESEFLISRELLSQSLAAYLFAFAIATLFWGPISDRFGRRHVIISGLLLYVFASIGCGLAENHHQFLIFRLIQGAAASGGLVAGRAMVRDLFDAKEARQVMSFVMIFFAIAPAIAPMIGAVLHDAFGWRSIFYFLSAFGLLSILLTLIITQETLPLDHRKSLHPLQVITVYANAFKHGRFQAIVLACAASFTGMFLFIAGAPTILFDFLGLETGDFWVQFVPMVLGLMAGSFVSATFFAHQPAIKVTTMALFIMAAATLLNVLQASLLNVSIIGFVLPLVIYAFAVGIAIPGFTILALDCFPQNRGTAAALQSFMQMMANAIAASLILPLVIHSLFAFTLAQLGFIIIAGLFWLKVIRTRKPIATN